MKTFLVVGGSQGIGAALVHKLGKYPENRVISISKTMPSNRGSGLYVQADILGEVPGLDISELHGLAYCPGSMVLKPFHCTGLDEFEGAYRINVLGAIKVIQTWLPALKLAGGSSVVLFGSVAANQGMPMHAGVATAKGAVEALTRTLAAEYAGQHIRFNCISPSLTDTPLAARLLNDENKRGLAAKRHPLGRYGTPEDVAAAAFFLLSDDPDWVTGQVMGVDGGLSTLRLV